MEVVDDDDDEGRHGVITIEQLKELLNIINEILGVTEKEILCNHLTDEGFDIEKAKLLLPTQSGFFFGGTEYDEYYISELKRTRDILGKYLSTNPSNVIYCSWW